jgi:DeoR family glycerol-3-phosphate regulon repressor
MLAGGQVRNHDGGVTGAGAAEFVDSFRMDIGILGVSGIDEDGSLLEFDPAEIRSAQSVLRNSRKVILVADKHKFGRRAMNRMGDLSDVDMLVTDASLDSNFANVCVKAGVEILVAGEEKA